MSTPASTPARARARTRNARGRGDELREDLLDAATELLHEQGDPAKLSVRAVTRRAGVSPMALYLHFADREELLWALTDRGYARFRERLRTAAASAPDPGAAIVAAGGEYMRFADEEPALYAVLFGPDQLEDDTPEAGDGGIGMSSFDDIVALVQRAMDAGYAEPGDANATAVGLWSSLHGFVTLRNCKKKIGWPDADDMLLRTARAWVGLRAPADG